MSDEFEELTALIEEELLAQIAMGRLGKVDPPSDGAKRVAELIADAIDDAFRLELKERRPGP